MMNRAISRASLTLAIVWCSHTALAQEVVDIEIKAFRFTPATVTVAAGSTVRWTNREKRQYHNVWFEALGEEEPDYLFPEESYERVFPERGEYPYRCGPHPEMQGVIHVR
jgi:plastocyanin